MTSNLSNQRPGRQSILFPSISCALLLASTFLCLAQEPARDVSDPTRPSARVKAALAAQGTGLADAKLKGLVLAGGKTGAVMLEFPDAGHVLARPNVPFNVSIRGAARKLTITAITADGVELDAPGSDESVLIPSLGPVRSQPGGIPGLVDYVEFRDLPLLDALRMLSDQTGGNYSSSAEANKIIVNVLLRNVPGHAIVEEICKSNGLWFKRDPESGIMRIMTVTEFEKDLVGFREEQTVVFTLKYPNVSEVATAIADLYGDRVQLSLGMQDQDDEGRRDLEERFDRFDVLTQRTQSSGALDGNVLGSNVNGFVNNGSGVYGFGNSYNNNRYGGGSGRYGYGNNSYNSSGRNRYGYGNNRYSRNDTYADEEAFRNLTPDQAERVERAIRTDREAQASAVTEPLRKRPATIYVTASRRNNMVVVRTADAAAMNDIRSLVQRMDVQTPLVLLEVKVVTIELGKEFRSAFDYQFSNGTIAASFNRENLTKPEGGGVVPEAGFNSSDMTFVVVSDNFRARMQLFEQKNRVKTLATPTLLTANNEISRLFLGEERPLVRGINSQTIITDNNVATTPNTTTEFRNVGNTLLITPNINADRTVTLRLVQENSFISPNAASIPVVTSGRNNAGAVRDVKVDVVATRSVSGTFVAKDGMAIAVGGLIEDDNIDRRGQVPWLGDIPGLGLLFRRQEKTNSRRELVIVIRPHVMTTPADSERLTTDVLKQLAPTSLERLVDDGFLPEMPLYPNEPVQAKVAKPVPSDSSKKVVSPKKTKPTR